MNTGQRPTRTESMVQAGHRKLFVTESGSGQPVVLLHGGGPGATGVSNYSRNIDVLAQHFHVIVPDLPGYGESSKDLDHSDPFGDLAFAIRSMLDELDIEKAHLVGNSYGGAAALRLTLEKLPRRLREKTAPRHLEGARSRVQGPKKVVRKRYRSLHPHEYDR